jgi:hypothetical protein
MRPRRTSHGPHLSPAPGSVSCGRCRVLVRAQYPKRCLRLSWVWWAGWGLRWSWMVWGWGDEGRAWDCGGGRAPGRVGTGSFDRSARPVAGDRRSAPASGPWASSRRGGVRCCGWGCRGGRPCRQRVVARRRTAACGSAEDRAGTTGHPDADAYASGHSGTDAYRPADTATVDATLRGADRYAAGDTDRRTARNANRRPEPDRIPNHDTNRSRDDPVEPEHAANPARRPYVAIRHTNDSAHQHPQLISTPNAFWLLVV